MLEVLQREARRLGLNLTDRQLVLFERYYDLLTTSGRRAGVTSVLDYEGAQRRHFVEPLALAVALTKAGVLNDGRPQDVLDLGSGGGFPGVPIKLLLPHLRMTLLDAGLKKSAFLREIVESLELEATRVVTARAEDAGRQEEHRGRYDLVLARAVAPLPVLLELAVPLLRTGGYLAAQKGSRARAEVSASGKALQELRAEIVGVTALPAFEGEHPRQVVLVRKREDTPSRYPRRPGIPNKRPLVEK